MRFVRRSLPEFCWGPVRVLTFSRSWVASGSRRRWFLFVTMLLASPVAATCLSSCLLVHAEVAERCHLLRFTATGTCFIEGFSTAYCLDSWRNGGEGYWGQGLSSGLSVPLSLDSVKPKMPSLVRFDSMGFPLALRRWFSTSLRCWMCSEGPTRESPSSTWGSCLDWSHWISDLLGCLYP